MDRCELRLNNIVREGEVMPQYFGDTLASCRLDDCIRRAQEMTAGPTSPWPVTWATAAPWAWP